MILNNFLQTQLLKKTLKQKKKFLYGHVTPFFAPGTALKNQTKLLSSLTAVVTLSGTPCPGHFIVPFGVEAPSGHLLPETCSPDGTDNRRQRQRQTERLPPEPSDILARFYSLQL